MRRGEIWWAKLPSPAGTRPVILLSRNEAYHIRDLVTIAPVTTRIRDIPSEVQLGPDNGLSQECVANLDTITTIPKRALLKRVSMLSTHKKKLLNQALCFSLGFDE